MKRCLLFLILASLFSLPLTAQYSVSGGLLATKNGITEVYLLNGLMGAQISFTSSTPGTHQWYRFSQSIDDAVPIPCTQNGNTSVVSITQGDCGYYVASPIGTGYVWIVDYNLYNTKFSGLTVMEDENSCDQLKLTADAVVTPIYYYVNGVQNVLGREFLLSYNTLNWDEDQKVFIPIDTTLVLNNISQITTYSPPLTNTTFTLVDSFAVHLGIAQSISSAEYTAIKVEAHGYAVTTKENADNEIHHAGDVMGGSAPITYTFTAYANDPTAALYIWKIAQLDSATNTLTEKVRYTEKVLQYNFEQNGSYVVSLEVSDGQSVCVDTTQSFPIVIDNTLLQIPNAFSPGSSIGVNDELRVAYTSLIAFKASIYNRWGNLLFQWTDPAKGWDGRVNGKFVPTGVYFVIVEYKDSNGKNRTMSKAVNVLRAKE